MIHPKDSKYAHWLRWFTQWEHDAGMESGIHKPFQIKKGWQGATDGRLAVVTKGNDFTALLQYRAEKTVIEFLTRVADYKPEKSDCLFGHNIFGIVGECVHAEKKECDCCHGKGVVPHHCNCDLCEEDEQKCSECDGECVNFQIDKRTASIMGHYFDANLVAYILEHAPKQEIYRLRIGNTANGKDNLLLIITDEWTAVICELKVGKNLEGEIPELIAAK